jgi:hypothetical protein
VCCIVAIIVVVIRCPQFEGDAAAGNYSLYIQKAVPIGLYAEILSSYPTSVQVGQMYVRNGLGLVVDCRPLRTHSPTRSYWLLLFMPGGPVMDR